MNFLDAIYSFMTGIVIRIALPVAVTLIAVWVLSRLDKRWQKETDANPNLVVAGPRNPGCWDTHNCSAEDRAKCTAYSHPETPCWQIRRDQRGFLQETCLGCEVFQNAIPAIDKA
jgi:hypothetical protein